MTDDARTRLRRCVALLRADRNGQRPFAPTFRERLFRRSRWTKAGLAALNRAGLEAAAEFTRVTEERAYQLQRELRGGANAQVRLLSLR